MTQLPGSENYVETWLNLSERLQMDSQLMLEKATKMVRQHEAVHQHNSQLQGNPETKDSAIEVRTNLKVLICDKAHILKEVIRVPR